jgi:5,10-methylenetetrahydromethanopterin reductase
MDFGISLALAGLPLAEAGRLARKAEANDMAMVSVGELAYDAFSACTYLSTKTTSIPLWTGIAAWTRPPVTTALAAGTVDHASGGRFTLGLGTMPAPWNIHHYGIDPSRPISRMREYVLAIRSALAAHSGKSCEFQGEFFQISGYRRPEPPLREDIPISLAATRPAMARLAGQIADSAYLNVIHTLPYIRQHLHPAIAQGREAPTARATFTTGVMVRTAIDDNEDRALELLRQSLRLYLGVPYLVDIAEASGFDIGESVALNMAGKADEALATLPSEFVAQMGVYGSVDQVAEQFSRYNGLVDWIVLAPPSGLPLPTALAHIERLVELPWVR